ncbi:TonB-dependent receptor [Capnocytophaga canis]|uniref:TonB-dependent receptor n=1 Tax=Capnocytophaga canis TaxID=1848903 RepID=A0A0B7HUI8_9FLAO|nr:carboxypeptidase-like regulatory domain-containing protein [Capnocytophaga canis]CEN43030.1 TonB-dependent receptor [Capnocytophaga canis]CEN48893.1 TonB-dependent receptor [Capnocytophaga canis]
MKNWFLNLALILCATMTYAQGIVTGKVIDGEFNAPLLGANVLIQGTTKGVFTDADGKFSLQVDSDSGVLEISYLGFVTRQVPFKLTSGKANINVTLQSDAESLGEVVVTGSALLDIAKERQTPVAVSTIRAAEIVEKLGMREFPEILNRTPSVYATVAGGGYGDSKINIRGFVNENIAVMVNGMPVNDMENSRVYWSNWAGISDVASAMQVQRGLGASKLAIASVGGTVNIVTRASDIKQGGVVSFGYGNNGGNHETKALVAYNTGKSEKGWSASVLFSRSAGEKYADATQFEGYNYFFALGYSPSEKHSLQFMMTGAPQWHNQRSYASSISDQVKYGGSLDKPNRKYNSDWGYLNGDVFTMRRNAYHKPVMMLNWDWQLTDASALSTVVYASFGRGFGTGDLGRVNGKRLSNFQRVPETGLHDFDAIVAENKASTPEKGQLIRRASVNSHDWYGFLTNFNHKIDDNFTFNVGLDGRYYYGYHHQVVSHLLGASAYRNTANRNLAKPNDVSVVKKDTPDYNPFGGSLAPLNEQVGYSNDGEVRWMGMFAQLEYSDDAFSAFLQGSSSIQGFQRIDLFLKPGTFAVRNNPATAMETKTGFKDLLGYNIKSGLNYNINEQHNVFANVGYYSKQPFFNAVYPNNKNFLNPDLTNEKIFGIEAGYGFKSSVGNVNVNVYRTSWKDRFLRKANNITVGKAVINAYANILGITEIHQGFEFEGDIRVTDYLRFKGSFSLGNWFYEGNARGVLFNESNEPIDTQGNVVAAEDAGSILLYLDKLKVGDSAQQTTSLGATINPVKGLKFDIDWRNVNNLYANLNIVDFTTQAAADKGTLKLPSFNLFDVSASYRFDLGEKQALIISANVNNLLDTYYITESQTNNHVKTLSDFKDIKNGATAQEQYQSYISNKNNFYKGIDTSNRVYFGFGRTWSFGLRYTF